MPRTTLGSVDRYNNLGVMPDHVLILGGGRWARVITGVMCDLLPAGRPIAVCSPRGAPACLDWVSKQGLEGRVLVQAERPDKNVLPGSTAVIVANAAREHASAGRWALGQHAAALIEKPLATSLSEMQELISFAGNCGSLLAAAHVFRFARYLNTFSALLPQFDEIQSIEIEWVDPVVEYRYGETKQYDPAIPVYVDCLPHAVSVLQTLFDILPNYGGPPAIESAGARVMVPLLLDECPCVVILQRNGSRRRRCVTVETMSGPAVLDFSVEPGFITIGGEEICADSSWNSAPRPLFAMLRAFVTAAAGGVIDRRLSVDTALAAAEIAEHITPAYQATVVSWLVDRLVSTQDLSADARYALLELLYPNWRRAGEPLEFERFVEPLRNELRRSHDVVTTTQSTVDHIRNVFDAKVLACQR